MKICTTCREEKDYLEFSKDSSKKDGHRSDCKVCKSKRDKTYSSFNSAKISANRKSRYLKNYQKERSQQSLYAKSNRELLNSHARTFKSRHKGKVNAQTRLRQAKKLKATPSWLTEEQKTDMMRLYEVCSKINLKTGKVHHVDHIVPLQGKSICGLHVPWNLTIIPATMNLQKGNSFGY